MPVFTWSQIAGHFIHYNSLTSGRSVHFGHISWHRHHIILSHLEILHEFGDHIKCATNSVNPCKSLASLNRLKKILSELPFSCKMISNCAAQPIISPWSACLSVAGRTHRGAGPVCKLRWIQSHPRNTVYLQPVETRVSPRVVGWAPPFLNCEQLRPIGTI